MIYGINQEGYESLKKLSLTMKQVTVNIYEDTTKLHSLISNMDGLGAYKEIIIDILRTNYAALKQNASAIEELSVKIDNLAESILPLISLGGGNLSSGGSGQSTYVDTSKITLTPHRFYIEDKEDRIFSIIEDTNVSYDKAVAMEDAIHSFTATAYGIIRKTYENPNLHSYYNQCRLDLDAFIEAAPKWDGGMMRGINIDEETANRILSRPTIDMLGPSSWSSDEKIACDFADGNKPIRMVFVLDQNTKGASVTHLSSLKEKESEILTPSGVIYSIYNHEKIIKDGIEYTYVYVSENEAPLQNTKGNKTK